MSDLICDSDILIDLLNPNLTKAVGDCYIEYITMVTSGYIFDPEKSKLLKRILILDKK